MQGSRCGSIVPKDSPTESVESVCRTNAVRCEARLRNAGSGGWGEGLLLMLLRHCSRLQASAAEPLPARAHLLLTERRLALTQPSWAPHIHAQWPPRFKAAARWLLLAACHAVQPSGGGSGSSGGGGGDCAGLPLSRDALLEVLALAAYPISAWT